MPTFGSLFSGLGGFDVALERSGFECRWQVEINPDANRVLAEHWPDVKRYKDICDVGRGTLEPVDVICGGSPCQDVSLAGKREGLKGERSGLFFEMARVIGELSPSLVLLENVPGLLSSNAGRDFAAVLNAFRELGARDIAWRIIDAQYLGVPQRRRRVFLVADFTDRECAGPILFESESGAWHPQKGRKAGQGVAAGLTQGSAAGSGVNPPGRRQEDDINLAVASTTGQGWWNEGFGTLRADAGGMEQSSHLVANILTSTHKGGSEERGWKIDAEAAAGNQLVVADDVAPVLTSHPGRNAGNDETFIVDPEPYQCHGSDIGRMGTLRRGKGDVQSGVPFVTHALSAEGADASEDGTGRGTPLVVNLRSRDGEGVAELGGEQSTSLRASQGGGDKTHVLIPTPLLFDDPRRFDTKGIHGGGDDHGDIHPSLRNTNPSVLLASAAPDEAPTVVPILEAQGRSGESQRDGTGIGDEGDPMFALQAGHQHAVAFGIRSDAVRDGEAKTPSLDAEGVSRLRDPGMGIYEDLAPTLDAAAAHFVGHETVSFAENQRGEVRTSDIAPQLTGGGGKAGQGYSATAGTFGVRRLLPVECERLQGLPEVTQTARIAVCQNCLDLHENRVLAGSPNRKLPSVAGNVENNESKESALSVAHLSARSDQNAKRPVVVDVLISSEGRNLAIRSQGRFLEYVNGAVVNGASPLLSQPDGFARLVALTLTTLENETQHGRAESQLHTTSSITQLNGSAAVNLCGRENAEHVSDAVAPGEMENSSIKFTTSQVGRDFPLSDSNSQTLCFSVVRAIASFIPGQMQDGNLYDISLTISRGWTEGLSDSARYRLIGNAVAVPVIEWIARRMFAALAREEEVA